MLTYRQFLKENEFKKEDRPGGVSHRHDAEVSGHKISVHFDPHGKKDDDHYDAAFRVDGSFSKHRGEIHRADGSDAHAILHHVHRVIHKFIREKNPKAIHLDAYDVNKEKQEHKQKVYNKLAHALVRHYGGHVEKHRSDDGDEWPAAHFHESYVWYVSEKEYL